MDTEVALPDGISPEMFTIECSNTCPFSSRCPLIPLSMSRVGHICALEKASGEERSRFYNLLVRGEDGLFDEARKTLYAMSRILNLEDNMDDLALYLENVMKIMRVAARNIPKKQEEIQEISINISQSHETPAKKPSKKRVQDASFVEADPESLIFSEKLQEITGLEVKPDGRPKFEPSPGSD